MLALAVYMKIYNMYIHIQKHAKIEEKGIMKEENEYLEEMTSSTYHNEQYQSAAGFKIKRNFCTCSEFSVQY